MQIEQNRVDLSGAGEYVREQLEETVTAARRDPFAATTVVLLTAAPMALVALAFPARLAEDWRTLAALPAGERLLIAAMALTSLAGTVLLYLAVRGRNATLASLIEISYPAFVAIFAWILFREWQLNAGVLLGALLVFADTAIIILNSR